MKKTLLLMVALALAVGPAFAQKLVIKGSDTLGAKLVPMLAEAYKAKHPEVAFEIAARGSTTGISAVIDGTAQIGMSSRLAKPPELSVGSAKGVQLTAVEVSQDGLAVIVNEKNPITRLTRRQVEQIFTGTVESWAAVGGNDGPVSIYTRNTTSGTYSDFQDLAMRKHDYASSSQKMAGNEQIASEVANNTNGIGYVGLAYTKIAGIRIVAIDGMLPDTESVQTKKYPYARPNFFYTNGTPTGETKKFVDFVLSDEGQQIVVSVGFVPIR